MRARPIPPQVAILLLALVVAALAEVTSFAGLALSYAVGWLIVNVALARGLALPSLDRRRTVALAALVVAVPAAVLGGRLRAVAEHESLLGLGTHVTDRLRLERSPALHPGLVRTDVPQRYFVRAEGARAVRVTIASGVRAIDTISLGHGVFRFDYDPRRDGLPAARGAARARIELDGEAHERAVEVIEPLAHPRWLRANVERTRACTTSEETDALVVLDARGVSAPIAVDDAPSDCGWLADGRVVVVHRHATAMSLVRIDDGGIERVEIGPWASRVAVHEDGARVAVAHEDGSVTRIDLGTGEVVRADVGGLADWIEWDGDAVIAARRAPAALVRLGPGGVERTRALIAPVVTMARGRDHSIVIAVTDWSEASTPPPHLGNHYVQDQLVELDARTLTTRRVLPTAHRSPRQDAAGGLDRGLSPIGIDVGADGTWTIAFAGSDELATLDPSRGLTPRTHDVAALGLGAPISAVVLRDGTIAASSAAGGRVILLAPDGRPRATAALAPDDATLLRDDPEALRRRFGERAFYEGTRAGISCQSCHLHGASDGLAHNIGGQLLSPTLDVRGIRGTAPYLRDGSYPRIRDLHEVAGTLYRGFREPAGDRGATLEGWIASLPPPLPLGAGDLEAERRGLDVFVRARCPDCHALPAATGLGRHPIASVFPDADAPGDLSLDAPSLRASARHARWLFDGRAASLGAIFLRENRANRHGDTVGLTAEELSDLVRFLESM